MALSERSESKGSLSIHARIDPPPHPVRLRWFGKLTTDHGTLRLASLAQTKCHSRLHLKCGRVVTLNILLHTLLTKSPLSNIPLDRRLQPRHTRPIEKPKEVFVPWYIYLLRLQNGCIYVGCTNDLERRLAEHRGGSGSKITSASSTVELIYSESFSDRSRALTREQQLKRWSRAKKLALATGRLVELKRLARRRAHSCRGERTTQPPRMHPTAN